MATKKKATAARPAPQRRSKGKKLQTYKIPPESLNFYINLRAQAAKAVGVAEAELLGVKTLWQDKMATAIADLREAASVPYLEENPEVALHGNLFIVLPKKKEE